MNNIKFWQKIHRFQEKEGWCGPAVIQMVLAACGVKKTQEEIARDVYKKWWGTNQQIMLAYLSRFFKRVRFKRNSKVRNISYHLRRGHVVVVNWWDDFDSSDPDGHYTIVAGYDHKSRRLTMVDPSNTRAGIWKMSVKDFKDRWYDYLDVHGNTWVDGWLLWVDPASKID